MFNSPNSRRETDYFITFFYQVGALGKCGWIITFDRSNFIYILFHMLENIWLKYIFTIVWWIYEDDHVAPTLIYWNQNQYVTDILHMTFVMHSMKMFFEQFERRFIKAVFCRFTGRQYKDWYVVISSLCSLVWQNNKNCSSQELVYIYIYITLWAITQNMSTSCKYVMFVKHSLNWYIW